MGSPKIKSFDSIVMYPMLRHILYLFKNIHPNWITLICIIFKCLAIQALDNLHLFKLSIFMLIERVLDCLDGEVARRFKKTSRLGNYLDKYSDVIYRIFMIYYCSKYIITLFSFNIYWVVLLVLTFLCPLVYILDWKNGLLDSQLECRGDGVAIYLEDNSTLLCFILPYILSKLTL